MKVKKIAALAVGAAMVGATVGFASAQPTVPEIPKDFFVKNGEPNVKIVVGSQGAALDVASAADIAVAIGSMLYTQEEVQAKGTSVILKKDISGEWDIPDLPVFGGSTEDPTAYAVFEEDEFTNPEDNEDAWAKWYVKKEGSVNLVPKNITLTYNSPEGDETFEVPLDGTAVEGPDGRTYKVVAYHDLLGDNPTVILDVDGETYALKKGETQILSVKPEYEGAVVPKGNITLPIYAGDAESGDIVNMIIKTNPNLHFEPVDDDESPLTLAEGAVLVADLTRTEETGHYFTFNATSVDPYADLANITITWDTVTVNEVYINGQGATLSGNSVDLVNVTIGDVVEFYTDKGIFDFKIVDMNVTGGIDYVRLNFGAGTYDNTYTTDSFEPSKYLDLKEGEAQEYVNIETVIPGNVTLTVEDVDLTEQNIRLEVQSNYYIGRKSLNNWGREFVMLELEQQRLVIPIGPESGDTVTMDLYVNYVGSKPNSITVRLGDLDTLGEGDSFQVGDFNVTVEKIDLEHNEVTLHITSIEGSDIKVDKTITVDLNDETLADLEFTMDSIEISVDLVTEGLTFSDVTYTTETVYEDGMTDFVYSEWADGEWDLGIEPGIVSGFVEWTIPGDDTYDETATVKIDKIALKDLKKAVEDNVPPKDATIVIPAGAIHVTVDLGYGVETVEKYSNNLCAIAGCDPDVKETEINMNSDDKVPGAYAGHELYLPYFNKTVSILDIGDDYFTYGTDYGTGWYKVGDEKTFDEYTIKVQDINIYENKVLLLVSRAGETPDLETVKVGETLKYYGLYVTVDDAFIGSTEDVIAKLSVKVEKGKVVSGDDDYSLVPGYITYLHIATDDKGRDYLDSIEFVNAKEISGDTVDVFNTYEIDYVYDEESAICVDNGEKVPKYFVNAYVAIDPYPYYVTKELSVGDKIEGWIVDAINAEKYTKVTLADVVEPITVLDTELMEAGLDSVDSNLILVGGPVVNAVTAALADKLEVPTDYDGWKEQFGTGAESGVIKYVAECETINGHGVVLVAGTDREGTAAAAKALMEYLAGL